MTKVATPHARLATVSKLRWRLKARAAAASRRMLLAFIAKSLDWRQRCGTPCREESGGDSDEGQRPKREGGCFRAHRQTGKHFPHFDVGEGGGDGEKSGPSDETADEGHHAAFNQEVHHDAQPR